MKMEAQMHEQYTQLFCDRNNTEMQNLKMPFGTLYSIYNR